MSMTNQEVCHAWFHGNNGATGENGKGSIFFHNDEIYSYGSHFMMARIFMLPKKIGAFDRVVVRTTRTYSITTTAHQGRVNSAIDRNIAFVADVEDAAKVKTLEDALEPLVNNAFDSLEMLEQRAKNSAWFDDNGITEIVTLADNLLALFKSVAPRHPLVKEVKRLRAKMHDEAYIADLKATAAATYERKEAEAKERARKAALKHIKPILAGNAHMLQDDVVLDVLAQDYDKSEFITPETVAKLHEAGLVYLRNVELAIFGLKEALLTLTEYAYSQYKSRFVGSMAKLRAVNAKIGYKELDDAILDLYDLCLERAKARYMDDFVDGGLKGDARFEIILRNMFGLSNGEVTLYIWAGTRPTMHEEHWAYYPDDADKYQNCIVWRTADNRIRTSMGVEIGMHEFKRFCRIIRALHAGTMTIEDIPEGLRKVQGHYTIHRYVKGTELVVVGCHRIAMNNLMALADLVCDAEA